MRIFLALLVTFFCSTAAFAADDVFVKDNEKACMYDADCTAIDDTTCGWHAVNSVSAQNARMRMVMHPPECRSRTPENKLKPAVHCIEKICQK